MRKDAKKEATANAKHNNLVSSGRVHGGIISHPLRYMNNIRIYFDGGCRPTNPGNKYGSYEVLVDGKSVIKVSRKQFGKGTNNEAEFNSLQSSLEDLVIWSDGNGYDLRTCILSIVTDSMILKNRLTKQNRIHQKQAWKESSERMFNLANGILKFEDLFAGFHVQWQGRENNVQRFGH